MPTNLPEMPKNAQTYVTGKSREIILGEWDETRGWRHHKQHKNNPKHESIGGHRSVIQHWPVRQKGSEDAIDDTSKHKEWNTTGEEWFMNGKRLDHGEVVDFSRDVFGHHLKGDEAIVW